MKSARPVDWQQTRERLARLATAAEEALRVPPERAQAILEERARILARAPAAIRRTQIREAVRHCNPCNQGTFLTHGRF